MQDQEFAVSCGSRHGQRCQDTLVLWLQDAQINRTQLVASTGGAYPAAPLGSANSVGTGRTRNRWFNEKVHPNQSRLTSRGLLEWIGVASFLRCVLQQHVFLQQPFWQPESLVLE
jgi:hypothetical protein